jgi:hypothetical protein
VIAGCSEGETTRIDAGDTASANTCSTRSDCEAGLVCGATNRCEACVSDGQCRLKERCAPDTARCVFKDGYGDDCTFNDECQAGEFCSQGVCRDALDVTLCVDGQCLASGLRCNALNGVCELDLGCLEHGDCAKGELCNLPTHRCVTRCTEESTAYLCLPGEKCLNDRCSACLGDADCAGGMRCDLDALACVLDDGGVTRCSSERDCALGQLCDPDLGICLDKKPPCTSDESCASSERCDIASGKCLPRDCAPDRFEPNDTLGAALAAERTLGDGVIEGLALCGADIDFHAIELERGEQLSATFVVDALVDGQVSIALIDPLERTLGAGGLSVSGVAVMDGRHALRVAPSAPTGSTWIDYGLTLSISTGTPCDFDVFEPNDAVSAATRVETAGTTNGLTICGSDVDFFRIALPPGQRARVQAMVTQGSAALDVEEVDELEETREGEGAEALFKVSSPLQRVAVTYVLTVQFEALGE